MSLNQTPKGERLQIGLFGCRNAGKSSLMNALIGQPLAIVSSTKGTTTDPVSKAMELLPLGPIVLIDTPGLDDKGELGQLRIEKAKDILKKIDLALLVLDSTSGFRQEDQAILKQIQAQKIPYLIVANKGDLSGNADLSLTEKNLPVLSVSTLTKEGIPALKEAIVDALKTKESSKVLVGDIIHPEDLVLLVIPIDKAAPKGRLILPQQQTIRDLLDHQGLVSMVQVDQLKTMLAAIKQPPALVITDSQVFAEVSQIIPPSVPLTSFSILFARYKGDLTELYQGAQAISQLKDNDKVLISEGCTHHRQCGDIGTEKLPAWLSSFTGKKLQFSFTSGTDFPTQLTGYSLVIHCGGCMLHPRDMNNRLKIAQKSQVPITNYGIAIAYMKGILERSIHPFLSSLTKDTPQ